jgi:hypothetical protein
MAEASWFPFVLSPACAQEATEGRRAPVPDAATLQRARKLVDDIYREAIAKAKTPKDRSVAARSIFQDWASAGSPVEQYAVLTASLDLAVRGDDASLVLAIVDALTGAFELDPLAAQAKALTRLGGGATVDTWKEFSERFLSIINEAIRKERFEEADELITMYQTLAKKAKDPKAANGAGLLRKQVSAQKKSLADLQKVHEAAKSPEATADDFEKLGRYLCFVRRDWNQGLPWLAKGKDLEISRVARLDLEASGAEKPEARLRVAEAWESCGGTLSPAERSAVNDHVIDAYLAAIPGLTGLAKVKAQKAAEVLQQQAAEKDRAKGASWVTIFKSANSEIWNTDTNTGPDNFATSLASVPPGVRYVRMRRANGDTVILTVPGAALGASPRGKRYGWQGAKPVVYNGTLLGIFDTTENLSGKPGISVFAHGTEYFSGYGFGHVNQGGGAAVAVWASKQIQGEILEISVAMRHLTADERALLLE